MSRKNERWLALGSLLVLFLLPFVASPRFGGQVKDILVFSILALGLNVVVGYTGLLQLGIAAFFGIGAYITGILTVAQFPFQWNFWPAMVAASSSSRIANQARPMWESSMARSRSTTRMSTPRAR